MALIWINDVSVSFGGPMLLAGAKLQIEAGERIGLVGRNGSGKTTLMKALTGDVVPDQGEIRRNGDVKIALLSQDIPEDLPGTVYDVVAAGGQDYMELLRAYHDLTLRLAHSGDDGLLVNVKSKDLTLNTKELIVEITRRAEDLTFDRRCCSRSG